MNTLIVVAHPDDEVLGCGATAAALADHGHSVRVCFLSGHAEARGARPQGSELHDDMIEAQRILGFGPPLLGGFPNIRMNTVAHIELVQFIERAIEETKAQVIFTHHPADVNDDHSQTSKACMAAARLSHRRPGIPLLRRLYFMEILSSTDWAFRGGPAGAFEGDTFVGASIEHLDRKLAALRAYRGVMRPAPHSRSEEVVRALAVARGAQAGMLAAEAFQTAFVSTMDAVQLL